MYRLVAGLPRGYYRDAELGARVTPAQTFGPALAPIGCSWRSDEVLGLPLADDCAPSDEMARAAYDWLVGPK